MREQIVVAARNLKLLNDAEALRPLDSLNIIDLVVELEAVLSISIPSAMLEPARFASIESIVEMIEELQG